MPPGSPDYIAVVAFNTFDDFVRRAYPMRMKLKQKGFDDWTYWMKRIYPNRPV